MISFGQVLLEMTDYIHYMFGFFRFALLFLTSSSESNLNVDLEGYHVVTSIYHPQGVELSVL